MSKKKLVTAAEFVAQLKADPEWVAKRAKEDEELQRREAEWNKAEEPLVEDLQRAGFQIDSAWDLVNTSKPYYEALPILLEHLSQPYPDAVREGIARALAVRPARFGWDVLVRHYREETGERSKDGLAVALAATADETVIDELISLAKDTRLGPSRLLLLGALERSSDPRARAALMELGTDRELSKEVQAIFRRLERKSRRRSPPSR